MSNIKHISEIIPEVLPDFKYESDKITICEDCGSNSFIPDLDLLKAYCTDCGEEVECVLIDRSKSDKSGYVTIMKID